MEFNLNEELNLFNLNTLLNLSDNKSLRKTFLYDEFIHKCIIHLSNNNLEYYNIKKNAKFTLESELKNPISSCHIMSKYNSLVLLLERRDLFIIPFDTIEEENFEASWRKMCNDFKTKRVDLSDGANINFTDLLICTGKIKKFGSLNKKVIHRNLLFAEEKIKNSSMYFYSSENSSKEECLIISYDYVIQFYNIPSFEVSHTLKIDCLVLDMIYMQYEGEGETLTQNEFVFGKFPSGNSEHCLILRSDCNYYLLSLMQKNLTTLKFPNNCMLSLQNYNGVDVITNLCFSQDTTIFEVYHPLDLYKSMLSFDLHQYLTKRDAIILGAYLFNKMLIVITNSSGVYNLHGINFLVHRESAQPRLWCEQVYDRSITLLEINLSPVKFSSYSNSMINFYKKRNYLNTIKTKFKIKNGNNTSEVNSIFYLMTEDAIYSFDFNPESLELENLTRKFLHMESLDPSKLNDNSLKLRSIELFNVSMNEKIFNQINIISDEIIKQKTQRGILIKLLWCVESQRSKDFLSYATNVALKEGNADFLQRMIEYFEFNYNPSRVENLMLLYTFKLTWNTELTYLLVSSFDFTCEAIEEKDRIETTSLENGDNFSICSSLEQLDLSCTSSEHKPMTGVKWKESKKEKVNPNRKLYSSKPKKIFLHYLFSFRTFRNFLGIENKIRQDRKWSPSFEDKLTKWILVSSDSKENIKMLIASYFLCENFNLNVRIIEDILITKFKLFNCRESMKEIISFTITLLQEMDSTSEKLSLLSKEKNTNPSRTTDDFILDYFKFHLNTNTPTSISSLLEISYLFYFIYNTNVDNEVKAKFVLDYERKLTTRNKSLCEFFLKLKDKSKAIPNSNNLIELMRRNKSLLQSKGKESLRNLIQDSSLNSYQQKVLMTNVINNTSNI